MAETEVFKRLGRKVGSTEIEIIQHLANDKNIEETGEAIGITKAAVQSRLTKLRIHFKVHSVASLVAIFFRNELIE